MKKGWYGEKQRHAMASRGVGSNITVQKYIEKNKPQSYVDLYDREFKSSGIWSDHFATGETLEKFLDTPEGEEFLEQHFLDSYEVPFNDISEEEGLPYWIDNYQDYTNDYKNTRPEGDEIIENVYGYCDGYDVGGIRTINGKDYYYISGLQGILEEEFQADNGDLYYKYLGHNFFRIWKPVKNKSNGIVRPKEYGQNGQRVYKFNELSPKAQMEAFIHSKTRNSQSRFFEDGTEVY